MKEDELMKEFNDWMQAKCKEFDDLNFTFTALFGDNLTTETPILSTFSIPRNRAELMATLISINTLINDVIESAGDMDEEGSDEYKGLAAVTILVNIMRTAAKLDNHTKGKIVGVLDILTEEEDKHNECMADKRRNNKLC